MSHEPWREEASIKNAKPKIWHIRDEVEAKTMSGNRSKSKLVRTIAAIEDGDQFHVGVAFRNPDKEPNFVRWLGREIAEGRARFAMAQAHSLTNRPGRQSRFATINTVSRDEFPDLVKALGVYLPEKKEEETQWDAVSQEFIEEVEAEETVEVAA